MATGEPKRPRPAARKKRAAAAPPAPMQIPAGKEALVAIGEREVKLTNLDKPFWPALGIAKRDLLQYYADVAPVLLPHLADRAMVMKRYPDGADGEPFFMKRAPSPRPEWIETCAITHGSGSVIDFPIIAGPRRRCSGSSTSAASTSTPGTRAATTSTGPTTCTSTSTPCPRRPTARSSRRRSWCAPALARPRHGADR